MKNNKRTKTATLILESLLNDKKLKSVDLRQIAFNNRTGLSCYTKGNKYYKSHNIKNVPNGWWCEGIATLRANGMIAANQNGY